MPTLEIHTTSSSSKPPPPNVAPTCASASPTTTPTPTSALLQQIESNQTEARLLEIVGNAEPPSVAGGGEGPWARARPPRRPHGQLCPVRGDSDQEGPAPFGVGDPEGELARAHRLGGRQARHCSSSPGPGPCLRRPGNGGSAGRPPVMNRVQSVSPRGRRNGRTGPHGRRRPPVLPAAESRPCTAESRSHVRPPRKFQPQSSVVESPHRPPAKFQATKTVRRGEPTA